MPPNEVMQAHYEERVMDICKATGCVCDRWADHEVYDIYDKYDEKHGTETALEYLRRCHRICFVARPPHGKRKEWEFELSCLGAICGPYEKCDFKNEEARLILQKEFLDFVKFTEKK